MGGPMGGRGRGGGVPVYNPVVIPPFEQPPIPMQVDSLFCDLHV